MSATISHRPAAGYQIYLQLKKKYGMNQLGQFFDGQELHEFDIRDRGVYQGGPAGYR